MWLYVFDVFKGSVIYHASVPAAGGACGVQATFAENWLVYHYFDDESSGTGQSSELSSYSNKTLHTNNRLSCLSEYQ